MSNPSKGPNFDLIECRALFWKIKLHLGKDKAVWRNVHFGYTWLLAILTLQENKISRCNLFITFPSLLLSRLHFGETLTVSVKAHQPLLWTSTIAKVNLPWYSWKWNLAYLPLCCVQNKLGGRFTVLSAVRALLTVKLYDNFNQDPWVFLTKQNIVITRRFLIFRFMLFR